MCSLLPDDVHLGFRIRGELLVLEHFSPVGFVGTQFSIMETVMTSMIDEFKPYLNTPKKIVLFRFGISFVFFLLGLSMVTRVGLRLLGGRVLHHAVCTSLGRSLRSEHCRSIPRRFPLADYRCD